MTQKWVKYVGKRLNYLTNGLRKWKMTQRFGNSQSTWEMAQIHGSRLKYLRNGFTMLEMALRFDKRLNCVGNDVCLWEMA